MPDQDRRRPRQQALRRRRIRRQGVQECEVGPRASSRPPQSLFKVLAAIYSFLTTADDIIGVVVADAVTGRFHAGTNWTALNDKTTANAWFKLEMK